MGILSLQIADLFRRARQCYADARGCDDDTEKHKLIATADDYVYLAKVLQTRQERLKQEQRHNASAPASRVIDLNLTRSR